MHFFIKKVIGGKSDSRHARPIKNYFQGKSGVKVTGGCEGEEKPQ